MLKKILISIDKQFSFLIDELGFVKVNEQYDNQYLEVIFQSKDIRIRIENYYRELYIYVSSVFCTEDEANIYNVIEYLNRNSNIKVKPNYYIKIDNLEESYNLQIKWLSQILKKYYSLIIEFYKLDYYQQNTEKLRKFIIKRYPDLFKQ